jgi:hypothetical protein
MSHPDMARGPLERKNGNDSQKLGWRVLSPRPGTPGGPAGVADSADAVGWKLDWRAAMGGAGGARRRLGRDAAPGVADDGL